MQFVKGAGIGLLPNFLNDFNIMIVVLPLDLSEFFLFFLFNVDRSLVGLAIKSLRPRFRRDPEVLDPIQGDTKFDSGSTKMYFGEHQKNNSGSRKKRVKFRREPGVGDPPYRVSFFGLEFGHHRGQRLWKQIRS